MTTPDDDPKGIPDPSYVNNSFMEIAAGAEMMYVTKAAFVNAGFSEEQAFNLVRTMIASAVSGMR